MIRRAERLIVAAASLTAACSREPRPSPPSDSETASSPLPSQAQSQTELRFTGSPSSIPGVEYLGSTGYTIDSVLYANFWVNTGGTQQVWLARATGSVDNETTPWTVVARLTPAGLTDDVRIWQAGCEKAGIADPRLVVTLHWDNGPVESRLAQAWLADPSTQTFIATPIDGISCRGAAQAATPQPYAARPTVAVRVATYTSHSDTIELSYTVQNAASDSRPVTAIALVTSAKVARMRADSDGHSWETSTGGGAARAPQWTARGVSLDPGQTSGRLSIVAVGMADVVEYRALPDSTRGMDSTRRGAAADRIARGRTVGVVPRASGLTAERQARRMDGLIVYACGEGKLISDSETCSTLRSKLAAAAAALSTPDQSRRAIGSFISTLDASAGEGAGKTISMTAYALLRPNASLLLALSRSP